VLPQCLLSRSCILAVPSKRSCKVDCWACDLLVKAFIDPSECVPRRKISVEPMFGLQQRGRSRPGMKVILSGCSKHLLQDPSGSSPSWHFSRSFWVQGLPISTGAGELTTFLFFWHKKQAPFSRTFAVSSGSFSFLVFRARTSAPSDWDSSDD